MDEEQSKVTPKKDKQQRRDDRSSSNNSRDYQESHQKRSSKHKRRDNPTYSFGSSDEDEHDASYNRRSKKSNDKGEDFAADFFEASDSYRKDKKIFDFEIFFEREHSDIISQDERFFLQSIKESTGIREIIVDKAFTIPGISGVLLRFKDHSSKKKYEAVLQAYKFVEEGMVRSDSKELFYGICLVPNATVSIVIGIRGKQINEIMAESGAKVIANQPINKMTQRTIRVEGSYKEVAYAVKMIYQVIEERSSNIFDSFSEQSSKAARGSGDAAAENQDTRARFVVSGEVKDYLDSQKELIGYIERKTKTNIRFYDEHSHRQIKETDYVCSVKGKLIVLSSAIEKLFFAIEQFNQGNSSEAGDFFIRLLIPNRYVTKLIGAGGCMIKELIARSEGAHIKIMSDKILDKNEKECLISIGGILRQKVLACCLILEQLEIFKNGGPILISGKSINDNLAGQLINSVQDQQSIYGNQANSTDNRNDHQYPSKRAEHNSNNNRFERDSKRDFNHSSTKGRRQSSRNDEFRDKYDNSQRRSNSLSPPNRGDTFYNSSKKDRPAQRNTSSNKSYKENSSRSRSRTPRRFKSDQKQQRAGGLSDFEGRIKMLVPTRIAKSLNNNFLKGFKDISRCSKLAFEEEDDDNTGYRCLLIKGTSDQTNLAFSLVQREMFLQELEEE